MFFLLKKDHTFVDRAFEFASELGPNWFLVDNKGHRHVKYNMDLCILRYVEDG